MVRRPDVADELAQEAFFRAWQARHRYREEGYARAYLIRIADRLVCDYIRRLGREVQVGDEQWKQVEPASRGGEPDDAMLQHESVEQLLAAMERLSPAQRRVLLLRYYSDMSFAEIASMMGCPLGTALSHCRRGLQLLRSQLVENEP
jgi:RNA polymerase sigma factor (sigma-70 family)